MAYEKEILEWFEKDENKALLKWFNNDEQNQELLKLYNSKSKVIKEIEEISKERLALLLLSVPQNYKKAKYKLMVIGQELNGGFGIKEEPRISMLDNLKAQSSKPSGKHFFSFPSKFCHAVNGFEGKLNKKEIRTYFIWAEIRKFSYWNPPKNRAGYKKPSDRLNKKVQNMIDKEFNILEKEIKIIKPDIVLFLTGPDYDNYIKAQLDGVKFNKLENSEYKKREFARVEHKVLPKNSFRIYHPSHFRFMEKGATKKYLAELIRECGI